jgi:hypothetical protein
VSQVVEIAFERLLQQQMPAAENIVTTRGNSKGTFSREDTDEGTLRDGSSSTPVF